MNGGLAIFCVVVALTTLWFSGAALFYRSDDRHVRSMFFAFAWGTIAVSVFMLTLLVQGIRPSRWLLAALPVTAWITRWTAINIWNPRQEPRNTRNGAEAAPEVMKLLLLFWVALTMWLVWTTLSATMRSLPGMGIWGYKAKLFFLEGRIPLDLFSDPDLKFCQPSYPLAFPLLAVWCYSWLGQVNDHVIQLLPVLFQALVLLLLLREASLCGELALPLGGLIFVFFLGPETVDTVRLFYAEPMLLFFAVLGLSCILEEGQSIRGWLLLGACTWIKNEGFLIFLCAWTSALAVRKIQWRNWQPLLGLLPALPWHLAVWSLGVPPLGEFAWQGAAQAGLGLNTAALKFFTITMLRPWTYAGVWLLTPLAAVLNFRTLHRETVFLLVFAPLLAAASVCIFMFSTSSSLNWHVDSSLSRLLIVPSCALVMALLSLFRQREKA